MKHHSQYILQSFYNTFLHWTNSELIDWKVYNKYSYFTFNWLLKTHLVFFYIYSIQILSNLCADNIHNCKTTRQNIRGNRIEWKSIIEKLFKTLMFRLFYIIRVEIFYSIASGMWVLKHLLDILIRTRFWKVGQTKKEQNHIW